MLQRYLNLARSYIGYKTDLKPFLKPLHLTFVVTLNCNLRCPFCYAWRTPHKNELSFEEIESVLSSRILRNLISIGITGGEPFLRNDIVDIASVIADRIPALTDLRIVTNGFYSSKIVSNIHDIMDTTGFHISVKVSTDGMESTHDKIRCAGSFSKVMETLSGLKKLREKGYDLSISIGFTAVDQNIGEVWKLYDKFGEEFEFFFKPAQSLPIVPDYCQSLPISKKNLQFLITFTNLYLEREFSKKKPSLWLSARKMYYRYLLDFLRFPDVRPVPCSAAYSFFKLDSDGTVYPCSVSNLKLGNVRETPLDEIWYSPLSFKIRRKIRSGNCACCTSCDLGPCILTSRWHQIIFDYIKRIISFT